MSLYPHSRATLTGEVGIEDVRPSMSADRFIPARQVWARYGVSFMTINRWVKDPRMGFPAPVYLGRFRYWRLADLETWERTRPTGSRASDQQTAEATA